MAEIVAALRADGLTETRPAPADGGKTLLKAAAIMSRLADSAIPPHAGRS